MNRTDRLLAIWLERQGKGHRRAEDLAKTCKGGTRTIYRGIAVLLSFPSGNKHDSQGEKR